MRAAVDWSLGLQRGGERRAPWSMSQLEHDCVDGCSSLPQRYRRPSISDWTNCRGFDQNGECPESISKNLSQRFAASTRLHSGRMVRSRLHAM